MKGNQNNSPLLKLPIFEGPLDLLLFLIRKNEVNIHDIPIKRITAQYLDILHAMEKLDLDIAGEFFELAATLMYIKSRFLLPSQEETSLSEETEELDPRWELVQQLLEYKELKETASLLEEQIKKREDLLPRKFPPEEERPKALQKTDKIELWDILNGVLRRFAERITVGEIQGEVITVADQMEVILKKMDKTPTFLFSSLFPQSPTIGLLIATFLAVLELVRLHKLNIAQEEAFADIWCSAV